MNKSERTNFLNRKAWKDFRAKILKERKAVCELCGTKTSGAKLNLHHRFPSEYDLLLPERFKLLCVPCHDTVERMALRLGGKDPTPNREAWIALLGPFLPHQERTVDKLMAQLRDGVDSTRNNGVN